MRAKKGTFEVYRDAAASDRVDYPCPKVSDFIKDLQMMCAMMCDVPLKSFCKRRLSNLGSKYRRHVRLNDQSELAAQKVTPDIDFYNIRKVDTHIHAASCMTKGHLLHFMKKMLKENAGEFVTINEGGDPMTLVEVFNSMNLTINDLTVDKLDVHAVS